MTSSTISRESAPTSSVKDVERVTCSLFTPRFSQTISITRSSTEGTIRSSPSGPRRPLAATPNDRPTAAATGLCTTATVRWARVLAVQASQAAGTLLLRVDKKRKIQQRRGKGKRGEATAKPQAARGFFSFITADTPPDP